MSSRAARPPARRGISRAERPPAPHAIGRAALERLVACACAELDLPARVAAALPARARSLARVIAVGKAAPAMAAGALARWGDRVERCLVVVPDGTDLTALLAIAEQMRVSDRLAVMRAGHPLPDTRSVAAGTACLIAARSEERRQIVVLVSGGASALVSAPAAGITLRDKRSVTRAMLASGASVQELNVVRKHLSRIKGGGLARAAAPNAVFTLVASDVIDGALADVGSGPTVPDATTIRDARALLRRFAPAFAGSPLARTPCPSMIGARAKIVVAPGDLAKTVARRLRAEGVPTRVLPPSRASAEELAAEYVELASAARARSRPRAFVRAAEPSVVVRPRAGRGGRSSHLAALVGRALSIDGALFGAFATDGVDGDSGTGGAIVDAHFTELLAPGALDRAIARFDTGSLHRALGTALAARPTGQNLADLHVLVVP